MTQDVYYFMQSGMGSQVPIVDEVKDRVELVNFVLYRRACVGFMIGTWCSNSGTT